MKYLDNNIRDAETKQKQSALSKWINELDSELSFDNKPTPKIEQRTKEASVISDTSCQVEELIQQIESRRINLPITDNDWVKIGFAFANQFGEQGREYFHRVSQMHSKYSRENFDRHYTDCLNYKGNDIGIGTFFQMCKDNGITYAINLEVKEETKINQLPAFPESIYPQLPHFLSRVISVGKTPTERDTLLIGAIGVLSACLSKVYGIYDGKKVYSNLYIFITGNASVGKGKLNYTKHLVNPIHEHHRKETRLRRGRYNEEIVGFKKTNDDTLQKPTQPLERMLFIPANSSATGTYQLLADNQGIGLIFETEGDTLSLTFKTEHGNYSDGFRKAFHHEPISYYRKTDREYVEIKTPRLSAVLSGTPKQINALIPSAENGLFSRFLFYKIEMDSKWKDVFDKSVGGGLDDYFENLGLEFYEFYKRLNEESEIGFKMTESQEVEFNQFFEEINAEYLELLGEEYIATVRRLGLSAFRICMTLSVLRHMETRDFGIEIICDDQDLQTAFEMVKVLIKHAGQVLNELPMERHNASRKSMMDKLLKVLPEQFNRQMYTELATIWNIPQKTADRYIKVLYEKGFIDKEGFDHYIKK
jgi:predicted transcriptional regulator